MRYSLKLFLGFLIFIAFTEASLAETTISKEGQYIFNSLAFYIQNPAAIKATNTPPI